MVWSRLRQKINVKYFMVGYLTLLLVFSFASLKDCRFLLQAVCIVMLYSVYDLVWTYLRDKVWYLPVSSWISGLVLSLVVFPHLSWVLIIILPLIAVISKQLFHFGKDRHVFNPASFALAVGAFVTPVVAWSAPAVATVPQTIADIRRPDMTVILFCIMVLGGLMILWRQKRWHVAFPFFVSYAFFLTLLSLIHGIAPANLLRVLVAQMINGVTIFFATVMLIEPMTSTFNGWYREVAYGILVGFAAVGMIYLTGRFNWPNQDTLVYGLLIGNLVASLLFLAPRPRLVAPGTATV